MKLAEMFVEFTIKGIQGVQTALGTLHTQLKQIQTGSEAVGRAATLAFGTASLAIGGFIKEGISASAVGDVLAVQMEKLGRNVAGLFSPEIHKAIDLLRQVNDWFRDLTEQQRENIVHWIKVAAAGLSVAIILPRIIGGLAVLVNGIRAVTVAMAAFNASTGGILVIVGAIVTALAGLATAGAVAEGGLGGIFETLKPILAQVWVILGEILEALKPLMVFAMELFKAMWQALQPIIEALKEMFQIIGKALTEALQALAPAILAVVGAFGGILEALAPILPMIGELIAALVQVLVPVIQIVAVWVTIVFKIIEFIMRLFVGIARVVMTILKPALEVVAHILNGIARVLAWIFGVDLDKKMKPLEVKVPEPKDSRTGLAPKIGGFEQLDASYFRIFQDAMKQTLGGLTKEDETLNLQRKQGQDIQAIRWQVEQGRQLVVK